MKLVDLTRDTRSIEQLRADWEAENTVATAKARVEVQLRDDERQRLLELMRSTRLPNMAQVREALIFLLAGTK